MDGSETWLSNMRFLNVIIICRSSPEPTWLHVFQSSSKVGLGSACDVSSRSRGSLGGGSGLSHSDDPGACSGTWKQSHCGRPSKAYSSNVRIIITDGGWRMDDKG